MIDCFSGPTMSDSLIVDASPNNIQRAAEHLRSGELVGIPTETVYGLAVDARNPDAVAKIFSAKGRPATNPLIVHVSDADAIRHWVEGRDEPWLLRAFNQAASFWPGPLTVVIPRIPGIPNAVTAGQDTVAIRVPSHPVTRLILQECGFPLAAPSANVSNYVSPTTARHVADGLGDQVAMVVDGGHCDVGLESTIIRLEESRPRLLRPGSVSAGALREAFGDLAVEVSGPTETTTAMPAPGMLPKHYSPQKTLRFATQFTAVEGQRVGYIAFGKPMMSAHRVWVLSDDGDLDEVARKLFAAIREADESDCDVLIVDKCDQTGVGAAIMDRLRRAVTP